MRPDECRVCRHVRAAGAAHTGVATKGAMKSCSRIPGSSREFPGVTGSSRTHIVVFLEKSHNISKVHEFPESSREFPGVPGRILWFFCRKVTLLSIFDDL